MKKSTAARVIFAGLVLSGGLAAARFTSRFHGGLEAEAPPTSESTSSEEIAIMTGLIGACGDLADAHNLPPKAEAYCVQKSLLIIDSNLGGQKPNNKSLSTNPDLDKYNLIALGVAQGMNDAGYITNAEASLVEADLAHDLANNFP